MKQKLLDSFGHLLDSVIAAAPKFALGVSLLIIGLIVVKVIEIVLRTVLVRVRFDNLVEKAGVDKMLQRIGLRQQLSQFIPRLVYYLLILVVIKTVADALGLGAISSAIGSFFSYLPNIIAALLVVILGSAIGQFVGKVVTQSAENAGVDFAPSLGRMVYALILFVVAIMAIAQLKIDTEMVRIVTSFILGAMALAFGISFGLGTRDIVRNVVAGFYARRFLQMGKILEIAGQQGIVSAITATHTILESEEQSISVSNATFLDHIAKQ